jgi:hypothetical protein
LNPYPTKLIETKAVVKFIYKIGTEEKIAKVYRKAPEG